MEFKAKLRNWLFISLIVSFCTGAILSIVVFITGNLGDPLSYRTLASIFSLTIYSLIGMASAVLLEKGTHNIFAKFGVLAAFAGWIFDLYLIWVWSWSFSNYPSDLPTIINLGLALPIIAISCAHASLILLIQPESGLTKRIRWIILSMIFLVTAFLLSLVFWSSTIAQFGIGGKY